jgi:hypothetical protein
LPTFFVFLIVQCFFIRYLIGLGNPTALFTALVASGQTPGPLTAR